MVWKLELVGSDDVGPSERLTVFELGEIGAPWDSDGVGVDLKTSHRILGELQRAVVALQERALKRKAGLIRLADPTLALRDYRSRTIQTLCRSMPNRETHPYVAPHICLTRDKNPRFVSN